MNGKKFFLSARAISLSIMILVALPTLYIDPFFHYRAPTEGVSYVLDSERYQNDGILRHFEYDAVIIGTSMTQNFKTSEADALFGTNSVKVPLAGGYFREIGDRLRSGFDSGHEIKQVILSLDMMSVIADKDAVSYDDYPEYLYDDNIFNDVRYLFNKTVLVDFTVDNIRRTLAGRESESFDEYSSWGHHDVFGRERVLASYDRPEQVSEPKQLTEGQLSAIRENLTQNIISLVREHPETTFYCFIPPYSILKIDSWYRTNTQDYCYGIYAETARMLLAEENVRVFCFYDDTELVCDLDSYRDTMHYSGEVNTYMLECMARGEHELSADTLDAYFDSLREYYGAYDFDAIFG